jgi:hypothetical protein
VNRRLRGKGESGNQEPMNLKAEKRASEGANKLISCKKGVIIYLTQQYRSV